MMEWTDRHCRAFHRALTAHAVLYSEMVTAAAIIHSSGVQGNDPRFRTKRDALLAFSPLEHPVALQIGGSEPDDLARAAEIGAAYGYDEINLNCGCPSDRVQSGRFGACLMAEPERVAACVAAMIGASAVPVTVKCRIGIDDQDSESDFQRFIDVVAGAGCRTFIVHARKAWLNGLSPKENRDVPPLDYDRVYRLKQGRPELEIVINGGIGTLAAIPDHLAHVDGVMLGRAAYQMPYDTLARVDQALFGTDLPCPSRAAIIARYMPYIAAELTAGTRLQHIARHLLGLYHGAPGGRAYRRHLASEAHRDGAGIAVITDAVAIAQEWAQRLADSQDRVDGRSEVAA